MKPRNNLPSLTGLKGIFCLVIALFHTMPETPLIDSIPFTSFIRIHGGTLGNFTFFMLSGFLISLAYRQRIGEGMAFGDYLSRRLRKLYPAYILSCPAGLLLDLYKYGISAINLKAIAFTLLLQAGGGLDSSPPYNGVAWFISPLFVCYILYYAISHFAKSSTQYRFGLVAGITAGYVFLMKNLYFPFCYPANGHAMLNFFMGCALAEVFPLITQTVHRWLRPVSLFVLLGSFYLMMRYGVDVICGDSCIAFTFMICPLILYISIESRIVSSILGSKVMLFLGKISMAVFFWHFIVYECFLYVYQWLVPGAQMQDAAFVVYLVIMLAWSTLFQFALDHLGWFKRSKQTPASAV